MSWDRTTTLQAQLGTLLAALIFNSSRLTRCEVELSYIIFKCYNWRCWKKMLFSARRVFSQEFVNMAICF